MRLTELIAGTGGKVHNFQDPRVSGLEFDSRAVTPGTVFIALVGSRTDGHDFIAAARERGAVAVVTQRVVATDLPQIVYPDTRAVMARLAKAFYGGAAGVNKIGITGTNGKTTTAFLTHAVSAAAGRNPALIGTIYYQGRTRQKAARTTPESLDLFKLFRQYQDEGSRDIVMEVSSHALALQRVDEIRFQVAVFTNLSQDHLDFHRTMDDYRAAKLHLFDLLDPKGWTAYNADDPVREDIRQRITDRRIAYGIERPADLAGRIVAHGLDGLEMELAFNQDRFRVTSPLVGVYNGYNILAACAAGFALGIDRSDIVRGIAGLRSVRGRLEKAGPNTFVDFAHTPKALEHVLSTLRLYARGRIIAVFGCGGDRDKGKRPLMGQAVSRRADFAIVTSDNPRRESPPAIIKDIEAGMTPGRYEVVEDRRDAIARALALRQPDDIVIVCGKGHEEEQIFKDRTIEFDDMKVVQELMRERGGHV